jgi:hypothetical protein
MQLAPKLKYFTYHTKKPTKRAGLAQRGHYHHHHHHLNECSLF